MFLDLVMTEISFYQLLHTPVETALPKLAEKILLSGSRGLIRTGSEEKAEAVCSVLWTFDRSSFLPHGTSRDANPKEQPIWITPDDVNPNGADIVLLIDGVTTSLLSSYSRCLDIFDGCNETSLAEARIRWQKYKEIGHTVAYWEETAQGFWESKT